MQQELNQFKAQLHEGYTAMSMLGSLQQQGVINLGPDG